jgi:hypothetical protein
VSRYRFIEVEKVNHAVRTLCRVLQVSRAAYYHWGHQPLSERRTALPGSERSCGTWATATPASGWPG